MATLPARYIVPKLAARSARPAASSFNSNTTYLAPEILVNDVADYVIVTPTGFPNPTNVVVANVAGTANTVPYTAISADVGKALTIYQTAHNTYGDDTTHSAIATIGPAQSYAGMSYVCGNLAESTDPGHGRLFTNATFDGRGFMPLGQTSSATFTASITATTLTITGMSSNGAVVLGQQVYGTNIVPGTTITGFGTGTGGNGTYTVSISQTAASGAAYTNLAPVDSNGFPLIASTNVFTAGSAAGADGTLQAGTYLCSYTSSTNAVVSFAGSSGVTVNSNTVSGGIGTYSITLATGSTLIVAFSSAIQFHDLPRDGTSTSVGKSVFWQEALAFYSKLGGIRLMGMQVINGASGSYPNVQANWADRPVNFTGAGANILRPYSPETILAFVNAVADYAGSKCQTVWFNLPGRSNANYATGFSALLNSTAMSSKIKVIYIELGNEPWNSQFANTAWYAGQALAELRVASNYGGTNQVTHIVTDGAPLGSATVTVTMLNPLSSYLDSNGNPYIVNGAQCVIACQFIVAPGWNAGTVASPATITVTGSNTFTYVAPGINPATYPNGTDLGTGQQWGAIFNLSSNLVNNGLDAQVGSASNYNLFQMGAKYYTRLVHDAQVAWQTNRPYATYKDRFILGLSQYGDKLNGGANVHTIHWEYAAFLGGGALTPGGSQLSWLYGAAIAPYTICLADAVATAQIGAAFFTASMSGGTLTVASVASGTIAVGQAYIGGGKAGTITGLGTGSGGTGTYTVSDSTSVIGVGTSFASGATTVMTVNTSPTGITGAFATGQYLSGSTTIPVGTTISSLGTGTGNTGTYNLSNAAGPALPFTVSGQTVSSVFSQMNGYISATGTWGFSSSASNQLRAIRTHVYMCKKYGLHPVCYEAGPDLQAVPAINLDVSTDARMGTFITSYLDAMHKNGIEECFSLSLTPANYLNTTASTSQAAWPYSQTFTDTTSPKAVALFAYSTPRNYGDISGPDGAGTHVLTSSNFQGYSSTNKGSGGNAACVWWTNNSVTKFAGGTVNIPRTRRYALTVQSTSATGEAVDVYVDGTLVGSVNSYQGGAASSAGSSVGNSSVLFVNLTFGAHAIDVQTRTGAGTTTPGIASITLTKY